MEERELSETMKEKTIINGVTTIILIVLAVFYAVEWLATDSITKLSPGGYVPSFAVHYPIWHAFICIFVFSEKLSMEGMDSPDLAKFCRSLWVGGIFWLLLIEFFGSSMLAWIGSGIAVLFVLWKPNVWNRSFSIVFLLSIPFVQCIWNRITGEGLWGDSLLPYIEIIGETVGGWKLLVPFLLSSIVILLCKNDSRIFPRHID